MFWFMGGSAAEVVWLSTSGRQPWPDRGGAGLGSQNRVPVTEPPHRAAANPSPPTGHH